MPIPSEQAFQKTYNSLSGVDIKAIFHNKAVASLQAISYAVQREKAPIYTMGHPSPRAFSRGKRGIAGTLIFAVFDTHALVGTNQGIFQGARFWADKEEIRATVDITSKSIQTGVDYAGGGVVATGTQETNIDNLGDDQTLQSPWYSDQIPPFDVVLTGANELGTLMMMKILGVEILNEGYGISIDDLMSEMQMTYVAREIIPWARYRGAEESGGGGVTLG